MKRAIMLGLVLVAVVALLLVERRGYSDREHEQFHLALQRLEHLDVVFNEDLLRVRFSMLESYDEFERDLAEMERLTEHLRDAPRFVSRVGRAEIARSATQVAARLRERRGLFEQFKSRNAVFANSRRYFPLAVSELTQRLTGAPVDGELAAIVQELTRVVLVNAARTDDVPVAGLREPDRLDAWAARHPRHAEVAFVSNLARHARQLLAGQSELDALTRHLLALPTESQLDHASQIYEQELSAALQRTRDYRTLLYASAALLALAITYALWTQREANRRLEASVAERTAKLAEASGLLEAMLENSPDQIYFKDRESRFVRFSKAVLHKVGIADEAQLRGRTDSDVFARAHAEPAFRDEQEIIRTGKPLLAKLEQETYPDGHVTWALTTKMPWRDATGAIVGVFGISKDVTALKEIEAKLAHERDQLRALLDSSPDTIYFKDLESRFVLVSRSKVQKTFEQVPDLRKRRAARSLAPDVPEAELLDGLSDFDTYQDDAAQLAFADEQKVIRSGQPLVGKLEKQTYLSGTAHWSLTCKMPWRSPDGRIVGTFGISKDVTALKEAEEKIEQMHQQLMEASRQAGMAEVATGVLHNVGNVLNSVNVSATLVADHVRRTKAVNVVKLAALFEQHKANLADFITHDPRGQMIPSYLHTLADSIAGEQQALFAELENLRKNIEHIKDIVAMQQAYARTSGVMEAISVPDMVEDALRINAGSLARHDVDTVRDYQARPVVVTDKHKVMQILINLVRNAKYACDESGRNDKIITVKITRDDRAVKIAVVDNGVGIPSENLTRIFAHGFTTRKEGHGFGLHSGALAARELGGELSVHSDGPGCGAAFTLILPNKSEGNSHE